MDVKLGKTCAYASLVTPKGELTGFNAIFIPSTKFVKEGKYNADILLNATEGKKLFETIKEVRTAQFKNFKKGKGDSVADITAIKPLATVNEETGEQELDSEGRWILKTSAKAGIKEGVATNKIAVFDAKGKPIKSCKIGAGSTVRLKIDLVGYTVAGKVGVSVKLLAVQIINLVEYKGAANGASFEGFEIEEGYEYDETEAEETPTETKEVSEDETDDWNDEQGY